MWVSLWRFATDGFIETTVGRGSFVSAQKREFYQEEQQRRVEDHLQQAADTGRISDIPVKKFVELWQLFYQEGEQKWVKMFWLYMSLPKKYPDFLLDEVWFCVSCGTNDCRFNRWKWSRKKYNNKKPFLIWWKKTLALLNCWEKTRNWLRYLRLCRCRFWQ